MKKLYPRELVKCITLAMADTPVVLINGPRQAGKTTLVQQYDPTLPYFTLDDDNLLNAALEDPMGFIGQIDRGIIDEVQRAPELLRAVKLSIDRNRRPGRLILTGSANLLALPKIGDSLAGRMEILTLYPLSLAEIKRRENTFLSCAKTNNWPSLSKKISSFDCIAHALIGGYPEMLVRQDAHRRFAWAKAYIRAIIERDLKDIATIDKLMEVPRLLDVLAHLSGQLINFTQIGGQIGLDTKTTQKYVGLLENLFLVKRLFPWHRNSLSRLIKAPKLHFIDSGILACMTRMTSARIQSDKSNAGALLETWVYGELLKATSVSTESWDIFHYRDKDQIEVDFVLENSERKVIGIEVKASSTVFSQDFHGLRRLASLVKDDWLTGIVLYNGKQSLSFGNNLWAIPFALLG